MITERQAAEERGVTRDRLTPDGYNGYSGVAHDGSLIAHVFLREDVDTPDFHQEVIAQMWRGIEVYEEAHPSTLFAASQSPDDSIALVAARFGGASRSQRLTALPVARELKVRSSSILLDVESGKVTLPTQQRGEGPSDISAKRSTVISVVPFSGLYVALSAHPEFLRHRRL